jgi:hypothetical protein
MIGLSWDGPAFGSWPPFGQSLPGELKITTVDPKETIIGFEAGFTFPPIIYGNKGPPQLPALSVPPMADPLPPENAVSSPTVSVMDSRRCVYDTSFRPGADIRANRAVPVRFACAGKCGDSEW